MALTEPPTRRPNACVPCHERKVRCDAGAVGTPCSRCTAKGRTSSCTLLPSRRQRRSTQRSAAHAHSNGDGWPTSISERANTETIDRSVEEDAQIHTLQLMVQEHEPTCLSAPTGHPHGGSDVIEYFDRLNSVSLLGEAIGQRKRKRLIQLGVPRSTALAAKQREVEGLEATDVIYLESKGVFDELPKQPCIELLHLWFDHVYPYTPILEHTQIIGQYECDRCSHFLLFTTLANVSHYASLEQLQAIGFSDRCAAQREFVRKAQLLYDFGCEKDQLTMLQGSILLSSIQASFAPIKDFRFWFHNAVRIATQMGLHRQDLGNELDAATCRLCRRIWWVVYARDVLFNVSGFSNTRCFNDAEVDVAPLEENDWNDASDRPASHSTNLQRCFFVERCKIASLEAEFLSLSRTKGYPSTLSSAQKFSGDIASWRNNLPEVLQPVRISIWDQTNVWIIILMALAYRLECIFLRMTREQFRLTNDQEGIAWCEARIPGCVFELDAFVGRAIVNDLVRFAPGSFIVCACNLLAFHIEMALDNETSSSQKTNAKTRIHVILEYLHDAGEAWLMARWTFKVSEWVVKRAGVLLRQGGPDQGNIFLASPRIHDFNHSSYPAFSLEDSLSEHWIQDFLDQNFFGQLQDELSFLPG